ncbi:hypothetical protein BCV70DRAFT_11405 [Testicularia cyperi]|uniref:THIF-type NAD/FAD binding fold domain-containing protein n=1 Tax=Testicularia cyperi TaxID=1882483 RepID=A0A317XXN0_9BASI|nr:hypothetical protein BCV70DRAFT_11405 [Testicularia cyperi]
MSSTSQSVVEEPVPSITFSPVPQTTASSSSKEPAASTSGAPESNGTAGGVTEDEAALYDRQIRLWGLEAQTRLRRSHILVLGWDGLATEILKNVVLSGVGRVTIVDPTDITPGDLASNFFFRAEEVGQPKCSASSGGALDRIRALNPLVTVDANADQATFDAFFSGSDPARSLLLGNTGIDASATAVPKVDVLVASASAATSLSLSSITQLNTLTRSTGTKFFLSSSYGLGGWYFSDQIVHDYLIERPSLATSSASASASGSGSGSADMKNIKQRQTFVPFSESIAHTWTGLTPRQQKRLRLPLDLFVNLAWIKLSSDSGSNATLAADEAGHGINLDLDLPARLRRDTLHLIEEKGLQKEAVFSPLNTFPSSSSSGGDEKQPDELDIYISEFLLAKQLTPAPTSTSTATTTSTPTGTTPTLAPTASILGGILSQDILNSISGRQIPILNWLFLELLGHGTASVHRVGELPGAVVVS